MKKFYTPVAAIIFTFLAASCTTGPNTGLTTEPIDVAAVNSPYIAKITGTWRGLIPCADCPGISYNLTLNEDNSFEETLIYQDRSAQPFTRTGTWRMNDGILELDNPENDLYKFSLVDGELQMLDKTTGQPVASEQPAMYRLKRDAALDNGLLQWDDSRKRGVDFVGNGHSPGWIVEVDLEEGLFFKTLPAETVVVNTNTPATPEVDGNTTTYRSKTENGEELMVVFTEEACTDAMSGKASAYTVTVTAKGVTYKGCGVKLDAAETEKER